MKATRPIDRDITLATVQSRSTLHTTTTGDTAKFEKAVEDRAVVANIVFALLLREILHVVRCNLGEKLDVFVRVELAHLGFRGRLRSLTNCEQAEGRESYNAPPT